jgi:hypothetical protein
MPFRAWVFVVAAMLAVSQVALARPPHEDTDQQQAAQEHNPPQELATPEDKPPRTDYDLDACYQSPDHEDADLCAQWRAAVAAEKAGKLTLYGNWISLFGAVLSGLALVFVVHSLRIASEANKISQEIGEAQVRGYLSVLSVQFKIVSSSEYEIQTTCENTGQSPIRNATVISTFIAGGRRNSEHRFMGFPARFPDIGAGKTEFAVNNVAGEAAHDMLFSGGPQTGVFDVEVVVFGEDAFGKEVVLGHYWGSPNRSMVQRQWDARYFKALAPLERGIDAMTYLKESGRLAELRKWRRDFMARIGEARA